MKHLGDITKLRGCDVPIVDCVIGGSPCQGLSNAGKRLGLNDERSGLYMEQIRIVKEMREHDRIRRGADEPVSPRYMVWENVPGAFSTGDPKGADFQAVLEEAIRIAEPEAPSIPIPPKGWPTSGCIVDGLGRWSLAWRVTDAQYWGVPQRRRRICMVVDFNGVTAPQIVFGDAELQRSTASAGGNKAVRHLGAECGREVSAVEDGLRGHLAESEPQREEAAGDVGGGAGTAGRAAWGLTTKGNGDAFLSEERHTSLTIGGGQAGQGYPAAVIAVAAQQGGIATVCLEGNGSRPSHRGDGYIESDTMYTPNTTELHAVAYGISPFHSNAMMSSNPHSGIYEATTARSLDAANCGYPACNQGGMMVVQNRACLANGDQTTGTLCAGAARRGFSVGQEIFSGAYHVIDGRNPYTRHIVRRLTPLECERLQGFPDGWTDIGEWVDSKGKKHKASDSPRYKALGNSISIPNWKYIIKRLCAHYERDATMASLFDGIGGFPCIWEQLNGKGSCLWASEIEEFPMAVTRMRFGE